MQDTIIVREKQFYVLVYVHTNKTEVESVLAVFNAPRNRFHAHSKLSKNTPSVKRFCQFAIEFFRKNIKKTDLIDDNNNSFFFCCYLAKLHHWQKTFDSASADQP